MGTVDGCGYDDQRKCTIVTLVGRASFSPNLTDLLLLQLAQMPRSPELVIFVSMMTTTTMMTQPITLSLVYERGVKIGTAHIKCVEVEKCQNDDTH